jgi:hypothetical protein
MGSGSYSVTNSVARANTRAGKSTHEIFRQRTINNAMNPYGVELRESRDSEEHPNSLAIVLGLDLTGSMGSVPNFLVKKGLPDIMDKVIQAGEKDPQVLFVGVGDHECDEAPLQIGQFESCDELLDKWLTDVYLEGGGGGNAGESYLLAWYFAAYRTSIDCHEKRGRKGFLFTIGDEPTLKTLPARELKDIVGDGQYENFSAAQLLEKAQEKYQVFHIHVSSTGQGRRQETIDGWKQLMGDNLLVVDRAEDVARAITEAITNNSSSESVPTSVAPGDSSDEEML